ncbi:MAG: GNAT family N-acetyltransferase [Actinobacteria bacterium 69-20]|nr:MAG: GNAT family N-acetyltransferase [Actinobacteria bacterium 69-20]
MHFRGAAARRFSRDAAARPLGRSAASSVGAVLAHDPVGTCMVAARFESVGMDRALLGGTFWGSDYGEGALCFAGPNLVPLSGDAAALGEVARALQQRGRQCASIVGRAEFALPLWEHLRPSWGPARDVRPDQPLMVCPDPPALRPDPRVVRVTPDRLDDYYPAAVAMFTEEVGVDPCAGDGGAGYRARVAELVAGGRAFAIFDGHTVVFKAEVGALSSAVALIQGVWVDPRWRGRGIASSATAAVVRTVQRWGRLPSLYVNSHNVAARAAYDRVGFHRAGTFASILF